MYSARISTEYFRGFPNCLKPNAGVVPEVGYTMGPSPKPCPHQHSSSSPHLIQSYMTSAVETAPLNNNVVAAVMGYRQHSCHGFLVFS